MQYHLAIRDIPCNLRPRERLIRDGPEFLSEIELLAILLGSGTGEASALELAAQVLSRFGGLKGLAAASCQELGTVRGVGPAKAALIQAAVQMGRRLAAQPAETRPVINCPDDVVKLMMEEMRGLDREHFRALLLNSKNQVLYADRIAVGTLSQSSVHPRELFKNAVKRNAAAVILVHNHPSGDPTPSRQDLDVTKRLARAGEIIGISVLDHVVIGDNNFVSFKASGLI
ncbi:MAG: DNA repair protein RadC [Peptococcaceae bacterium]|nr:DNA repair protein RadC [Peptococcaceae bacterium]